MAEQIKAQEILARACANVPVPTLQDIVNGLQAYHEQYYEELTNAGPDTIMRAQGKVKAISEIVKTIIESRSIVAKIDTRRAAQRPPDLGEQVGKFGVM